MRTIKLFGKQWVVEEFLPGEKKGYMVWFSVRREIFRAKTQYQDLFIFENKEFGRILMLNGLVQLAEVGEEAYHEMLVHPALLSHKNPERVMIVGGGDGAALRETLKHPVKEVVLVEIDKEVIEASKKYLPSVSRGAFADSRVTLVVADALKAVPRHKNEFDCVIMDSNDPDGKMAGGLFSASFFQDVKKALKKDGIFAAQTGHFSEAHRKKAQTEMKKVFKTAWAHRAFVKYFPADEHSFSLASRQKAYANVSLRELRKRFEKRALKTSYYSPEIHIASAVLPPSLKP